MTEGWKTKSLGEVCEIVKGRKPTIKVTPSSGDLPYLVAKVMRGSQPPEFASVNDRNSILVGEDETIIICDGSNSGEVFTGFRGILSSTMGKIVKKEAIDDAYLRAFLDSTFEIFNGAKTGAAIPHLDKEALYSLSFSYPPLPEQRRIVAILDEAFEAIVTAKNNAEKNLKNAHALLVSTLAKIFSADWALVRIEDACQSIIDCVNKTAPTVSEETPYKMIRTTNVRNGVVSLAVVNYVSEDVYKVWTRRQLPRRGDVLLTREAPLGEVGMLDSDEFVFLGQRLVSYRAEPTKLDNRFLLYALQSEPLQRQIHALASGSTVQHMRVPDSKNLQLPLPSLHLQREAVATLDAMREEVNNLRSIYDRKIAALDELKKSFLHQAFTGQLTAKSTDKQLAEIA